MLITVGDRVSYTRKQQKIVPGPSFTALAHRYGLPGSMHGVKFQKLKRMVADAICLADGVKYENNSMELLLLDRMRRNKARTAMADDGPIKTKRSAASSRIPKVGRPHEDYVKDDGFYKSREWQQLRYLALRNNGAACQCCGARAVDGASLHVDHIIPRYKAPHLSLALDNLQVLCGDCNMGKGAWDSTDWRDHFKSI